MPPVPQHILNWLYSVLTSEYHDVNRTYGDVAQAISQYPSLSPRTDVHTFDNGTSALLVHLSGTIPIIFRGTTYRFPISIWVPHAYPREAPLVYVTPTETMMVRPGQHVDPQGQVYHPYLAGWSTFWDKSTILDFLAVLRDIFAKEPPVIARQARTTPTPATPPHQQQQTQSATPPPPVPPPPSELAGRDPNHHPQTPPVQKGGPPPPPPKTTGQQAARGTPPPWGGPSLAAEARPASGSSNLDRSTGPPVPTKPPQAPSRYDSAPPLPHEQPSQLQQQHQEQYHRQQPTYGQSAPHAHSPHVSNFFQRQSIPHHPQQQQQQQQQHQLQSQSQSHQPPFSPSPSFSVEPYRGGSGGGSLAWQQLPPIGALAQLPAQEPKSPPPPNLLDEPLTLNIPSQEDPSSHLPPPPIPPNPEKDALLRHLAQTLHAHRQRSREQDRTSLAGLHAQRVAMSSASAALQAETTALGHTSALLASNADILRDALRRADAAIEGSARQTAPNVDDLLVAPTVVANQLYALVAEERAMGDSIFVLGRAVERGRISPAVFAKTTRSLAREWYFKKALARKIAKGMGLSA